MYVVKKERLYKRPESILVVVYTEDYEILALRRRQPDYFWQSVAGSLEWDETPDQAAQRELYEETGLSDTNQLVNRHICSEFLIYPMWRHRYAPEVISNKEYLFSLKIKTPCRIILDVREHSEYRWLSLAEAMLQISSHTNRDAINTIIHSSKQ